MRSKEQIKQGKRGDRSNFYSDEVPLEQGPKFHEKNIIWITERRLLQAE